ncbi:MAG: deoxynucleoside kinase [Thauera sp.]|jgi:deoxyadenosine/deoxycytidine kinase|nr:deoxynucleoside kinase [Thauera sp.]
MLDKAQYIVVEGPIGVGKTSLAKRLASHLQAELLLEAAEFNPFLARFYQQPERWAMSTELSFLFQRLDLLKPVLEEEAAPRRVADFILDKNRLFAELNLNADELPLYQRIWDSVIPPALPKPDLVIYLQANVDTLLERVHKRGIDSERRIGEEYLRRLSADYTRFFYQYDAAPLFIVDTGKLNPVDDDEDFAILLSHLNNMRGYREFFSYAA